ncbi:MULTISPECIES: hypothetical protein [Providencia]|uniref:hypothetical protein n=1 Tax=Providencia TaxID=586 RepID=UPI000D7DDA07|nr:MULTISPECIES: hypothetical protein [Providencia]AWS49985.1 hypothetical protein AM461_03780 [Providencia rettgeri]MCG5293675.1 hypothetical protein [Providencia rettgeri]
MEKTNSKKVAVFDICDTLYPCNTTYTYIESIFNKKSFWPQKYLPIKIINKIIYKLLNIDLIRHYNISLLKGKSVEKLNYYALDYVSKLSANTDVIQILKNYHDEGYDIMLASATLEPVANAISNILPIKNYFATQLLFNSKKECAGRLAKDLLGCKKNILESLLFSYDDVVFITDNKSDANCIEVCNKFIAIIPKGKINNIEYWHQKGVKNILCL